MSLNHAAVAAACAIATAVGGFGIVAAGALGDPASANSPICTTSGPVRGLSTAQAANARVIVAVATQRGGAQAAQIALMVALAESNLLVLANPNDPTGSAYPSQGVGYDHDSLGLFQQRPGWGTAAQRMDPTASTNLFLDALLATPHWSTMPPSYAAQLVQRSAYTGTPNAANHYSSTVGGNYLVRQAEAVQILNSIQPAGQTTDCGGSTAGLTLPANAASHGLPNGYTVPSTASPAAVVAVTFALAQLGKPYQWGATGPAAYDCSGLTQAAWRRAGVTISRVTYDQARDGAATDVAHLRPGDLVLTPGSDGSLALPGHVGMYIGDGLVVEAPHTGDVVKVVTFSSFVKGGSSALRHVA